MKGADDYKRKEKRRLTRDEWEMFYYFGAFAKNCFVNIYVR